MSKPRTYPDFNPSAPSHRGKLFGLPYERDESEIILVPVPWEVTVSYKAGTALGPQAILQASEQVDLSHSKIQNSWLTGINMLPIPNDIYELSTKYRALAETQIQYIEQGKEPPVETTQKINAACETVYEYVYRHCDQIINEEGKIAAVIGGDHSSPLGLIHALSKKYNSFSILQVDAHCDLRKAYEGFSYSHASIMYNALKIPAVKRLVQIGIRDYCEEELMHVSQSKGRVKIFFDRDIKSQIWEGKSWQALCQLMVNELSDLIYISFDIDGLDPSLCPHTGTPVPGGFEFDQISILLELIAASKKKLIGFDLCEVSPGKQNGEWDGNVGARVLRELYSWTAVSQKIMPLTNPHH